jgi:hypothetical protein
MLPSQVPEFEPYPFVHSFVKSISICNSMTLER